MGNRPFYLIDCPSCGSPVTGARDAKGREEGDVSIQCAACGLVLFSATSAAFQMLIQSLENEQKGECSPHSARQDGSRPLACSYCLLLASMKVLEEALDLIDNLRAEVADLWCEETRVDAPLHQCLHMSWAESKRWLEER
jgi:hypothetical protein